ncbi:MAG: hypothetical protein J6K21_03295 [Bacilli bacterium]|nr:hypothetical protein [Bacilli bacterium]
MEELNCGSSCIKYILDEMNYLNYNLNSKLFWIVEMGINLNSILESEVIIKCYKSKLLHDYKKYNNIAFDGFEVIKKYYNLGYKIYKRKLNEKILKKEIMSSRYIIINVESRLLYNDPTKSGGHYIIITNVNNNVARVVIPSKNDYIHIKMKLDDLVNFSKNFGAWRILIK